MISVPTNGARLGLDKEGAGDGNGTRLKADLIPANLIEGRIEAGTSPTMACRYLMEVRQNGRAHQEDCCAVFTWDQEFQDGTSQIHLFTIMDGHSCWQGPSGTVFGLTVATRMREAFETTLKGLPKSCLKEQEDNVKQQLADQGMVVDQELQREGLGRYCGTTCSFALVFETHVVIGNVGDSTVFYSCLCDDQSNTEILECDEYPKTVESFGVDELQESKKSFETYYRDVRKTLEEMFDGVTDSLNTSEKQKEGDPKGKDAAKKFWETRVPKQTWYQEFKRIEEAGAVVGENDIHSKKFTICLQMTRAFGDFDMKSQSGLGGLEKQAVIARPSIKVFKREVGKREIIGLFTDGVAFNLKKSCWNRQRSVIDFLMETVQAMKIRWKEESLVALSDSLNSTANRRRNHNNDNAGVLLVKFQESHQRPQAEDTDTKTTDNVTHTNKKCKTQQSGC